MTNYDQALLFARVAHEGQTRKYTGEPYINHCLEVVSILEKHEFITDFYRIVGILHDTVEDTTASFQQIQERFGREVMEGVFFLTDVSQAKHGNREVRKELDRLHILGTRHPRTLVIKCADLISNTSTIVQYDPQFAETYLEEKKRLLVSMPASLKYDSIWKEAAKIVGVA